MKLVVMSDYGKTERQVSSQATEQEVLQTMQSLDWSGFHQVVLHRPNGDWLEVGGSMDPLDGLSVMFEEGGKQLVIKEPPSTPEEMTQFLLGYLSCGDDWKKLGRWH